MRKKASQLEFLISISIYNIKTRYISILWAWLYNAIILHNNFANKYDIFQKQICSRFILYVLHKMCLLREFVRQGSVIQCIEHMNMVCWHHLVVQFPLGNFWIWCFILFSIERYLDREGFWIVWPRSIFHWKLTHANPLEDDTYYYHIHENEKVTN